MTNRAMFALVALSAVLLACGSDEGSSATPTNPTTADPSPASTSPVSIAATPATTITATTITATSPSTVATTAGPSTVAPTPLLPDSVGFSEFTRVESPVDVAYRDTAGPLFIVGQGGTISAVDGPGETTRTVLSMAPEELVSGGEQGLLGLAFAPSSPKAYINYTNARGATEIAEYSVGDDGVFEPSTKRIVLTIDQPFGNHNGGGIRFGADGYLYIGMGDGGAAGDPGRRSLDTGDLLGKMLRIDPAQTADGSPYSTPADNPYVGVDGARGEIWSIGLRNPWRFNFDLETNDLWIADVGQNEWEEIDVAWASEGTGRGANFGWSAFEGTHRFNDDQPDDGVTPPIHEYQHGNQGCSISGGVRYRGSAIPALVGWYVYADYCNNQVRALKINADGTAGEEITFSTPISDVSSIGQDANGELYATSLISGVVYSLTQA